MADVDAAFRHAVMLLAGGHEFPVDCEYLIQLANTGWEDAHIWLCDRAAELMRDRRPLPIDLQEYIVTAARKGALGANNARSWRNAVRNIFIVIAIERLLDQGFHPYRNSATQNESACSIVARALGSARGEYLSEAAIAKIWERRNQE
jgi:hypothetical protein